MCKKCVNITRPVVVIFLSPFFMGYSLLSLLLQTFLGCLAPPDKACWHNKTAVGCQHWPTKDSACCTLRVQFWTLQKDSLNSENSPYSRELCPRLQRLSWTNCPQWTALSEVCPAFYGITLHAQPICACTFSRTLWHSLQWWWWVILPSLCSQCCREYQLC